jgi:hypothetical protein
MTKEHIVVVCGRGRAYAFGPFPNAEQAAEYAERWLAQASYQVVPITRPRKQ